MDITNHYWSYRQNTVHPSLGGNLYWLIEVLLYSDYGTYLSSIHYAQAHMQDRFAIALYSGLSLSKLVSSSGDSDFTQNINNSAKPISGFTFLGAVNNSGGTGQNTYLNNTYFGHTVVGFESETQRGINLLFFGATAQEYIFYFSNSIIIYKYVKYYDVEFNQASATLLGTKRYFLVYKKNDNRIVTDCIVNAICQPTVYRMA